MRKSVKYTLIALAVIVGIFGIIGGYDYLHRQNIASTSTCWTAAQSWNEIGHSGCVQYNVGSTYTSSRCNAYLDQYSNYSSGFTVWIPDGCSLGKTLLGEYANKTIDVQGTITRYDGAPEIEVNSASQVSLAQ